MVSAAVIPDAQDRVNLNLVANFLFFFHSLPEREFQFRLCPEEAAQRATLRLFGLKTVERLDY